MCTEDPITISARDVTGLTVRPAAERCYRIRRNYLVLGIFGTISFGSIGIVSTIAAYWNIDGSFRHPKQAALLFGIVWSCFTLLSIWLILAYVRARLCVSHREIKGIGCIRTKTISVPNVTRIIWRIVPRGGSVVVCDVSSKIKISLENFNAEDRHDLITFFRECVAADIHEGWPRFAQRFLEPGPEGARGSRTAATVTVSLLVFFATSFVCFWIAGLGVRYLVYGILNAAVAAWYVWHLRVRRRL